MKALKDKNTGSILRILTVGPNAAELIGEGVVAKEYGGSSEDIARTCNSHRTLFEAIPEAAMAESRK